MVRLQIGQGVPSPESREFAGLEGEDSLHGSDRPFSQEVDFCSVSSEESEHS